MTSVTKRRYPVKRMDISINMKKTGARIKQLILESGYTMREIMEITGITTVQTIYKWYSGKSIPSIETQLILCRLFNLRITDLLVLDGESDSYEDRNARGHIYDSGNFVTIDSGLIITGRMQRLEAYYHRIRCDAA